LTFTSPSAVQHFHALLDDGARRAVADCIVAAVGTTTARALRDHSIEPAVVPKHPDVRELVRALAEYVSELRRSEGRERDGNGGDR
jgi:uroporphyrinogen-III synthase